MPWLMYIGIAATLLVLLALVAGLKAEWKRAAAILAVALVVLVGI